MEAFIFCSKSKKSSKSALYGYAPIFHFSEIFSWLICLDIFSQVWKTASFYPPVFVDFSIDSIAFEAISYRSI